MSRFHTLTLLGSLAIAVSACAAGNGGTVASPSAASTATPEVTSGLATASPAATPLLATSAQPSVAAGGSIAYQGPIEGGAGIRIVGTDGIGDRWLFPDVKLPKDGWQVQPDWSPDGTRVAFAADDPRDPPGAEFTRDLWIGDADGADAQRVFDCVSPCIEAVDPAWSPDGSKLAFATWGPQPASLAVLDLATGSMSIILTADHDPDGFRHPRWSPDGRRIVLEHQTWTGGAEDQIVASAIGIVDLDAPSSRFTPITEPAMWAAYPDWHPTEDRIVFSTRPWSELADGPSNLYTITPDGSGTTTLTDFAKGESRAVQPTWTPGGTQIIFTKVEGTGFGNPTMATIKPDGTGLTSATTSGPMFGTHPRLRPMP